MYQVNIEFLRVQTFLFSVPRLRNMVGANVLLGEMIRLRLPKLLAGKLLKNDNNPFVTHKPKLPPSLNFKPPCLDPLDDPLAAVQDKDKDKPADLYQRGILRRDGGHFSALFNDKKEAENFKKAANNLLLQELPGLRFEISLNEFGDETKNKSITINQQLVELPQIQVCQVSGNGPAAHEDKTKEDSETVYISESAYQAKKKGWHFSKTLRGDTPEYKRTRDMVSMISRTLLPSLDLEEPPDFQNLCGTDYMAVIHADGNSIGLRYKDYKKTQIPKDLSDLHQEMYGEQFYYSMRVAVRAALKQAIDKTFADFKGSQYRPYQILMLGGDDLLMICRARHAFDFSIEYAKALQDKPLADGHPLTVGIGMVIASPSLPFYHLHHLAESLASSAKQLFRSQPDAQKTSVIDWIVSTQAWVDDPIALRRQKSLLHYQVDNQRETLRLNNRPYQILGDDLNALEGLWKQAKELETKISGQKAARSQLRQLVFELKQGRLWADLAALGLPNKTQKALTDIGVLNNDISLWKTKEGSDYYHTALADLMELYEIHNLQREDQGRKK
ncbi:MAG: hypothetical protein VSS75_003330 [Candidatus Parabeggiatoa sp.]|nr:hypothetical protein [Candidatus Parabeggiatoa sp.]